MTRTSRIEAKQPMGIVTEHLRQLIAKQVNDYSLVVWYDPERYYADVACNLALPDATVECYDGSFFALRHKIEPLMGGYVPPRLVVYVPLEQASTQHALAELEAAGIVMMPGQQPPTRNTRLALVARNALKLIIGEANALEIEKQTEAGKLTLVELDDLAGRGESISKGVVAVIFGTNNAPEIALRLLDDERLDADITKKDAGAELALLLGSAFEIELEATGTPAAMRAALARYLLATEFIASLYGETPVSLTSIPTAKKDAAREAATHLVNLWRRRSDLRDSYATLASKVEEELRLGAIDFTLAQIDVSQTFLATELKLCALVAKKLLAQPAVELVELARDRQSSFWSEHLPDVQSQWALIAVTGQMLVEAARLDVELKSTGLTATGMIEAYTADEGAWCMLDTHYRHMERRYHNFDFDGSESHAALQRLLTKARQRYMETGGRMAEMFVRALRGAKFQTGNVLRQTQVFERRIKPLLDGSRIAYVWVDALRYEMGRELAAGLRESFDVELEAAVAAVPTVTEIGMAAMLPGEDKKVVVSTVAEGKLALSVSGQIIKDRKDRIGFMRAYLKEGFYDVKLEELLPSPKKRVEDSLKAANFILVTSQEIDALGEGDNIPNARRWMDEMLLQLRRAFRVLANLGVEKMVIVADHGYLFGDDLEDGMKIDAPGGNTADLHRRVWVGRGGTASDSVVRARLADFALGEDLELAAPLGFACFKVKGGTRAYFHGGLAPQELIIPVITLTVRKAMMKKAAPSSAEFQWQLVPGSSKISTRFFSVGIKGAAGKLYEVSPPRVRLELRAKGSPISLPVSASYGFEEGTGDVQLRFADDSSRELESNTVTLQIVVIRENRNQSRA